MPRARKPPPLTPADRDKARRAVDARIDAIVALMERGKWRAGVSHQELATRFGVSLDTLYEDARAAGAVMRRLLATTPEERQAARALLLADLEHHRRLALGARRAVQLRAGKDVNVELVAEPDIRAANDALAERAKVLGLYAPQQVEVSAAPPELERLTLAELQALDAEIGRRRAIIQARIATLTKGRA